jgi:hypothetical protein
MKALLLAAVLAISWVRIAAARPATDAEARKGCMPQQPCPVKGAKWQVNQCVSCRSAHHSGLPYYNRTDENGLSEKTLCF